MAEAEEEIYCLCRRAYNDGEFMIQCDVCKDWFHGSCVGVEEYQAGDIDSYHCPNCQPEHGPLTLKRRRNWHRHDYSEINDGKKAVQTGTVVFINNLKKNKNLCGDEILLRLPGSQLTPEYLSQHGFGRPILVEQKAGLGIVVPSPDFRVADVEKYVGPLREVDVIDVNRQDDFTMKMREWTDYYEATETRKKILNVISLEFSNTDLAKLVSPPAVVRQIDWIERHWPNSLPEDSSFSRPRVQKYCLMSVKDSYTDFHVDFGGTSVWYHIIRGEKVFYFIPPTEENLLKYEQWVMSSNQSEIFFGDLVPKCWKCHIKAGNTLFIPTGWIHAVLTPQDSLVFGGNYVHRYNIGLQLRVYEMELRLDTPLKFLHPCYEALTWFAARDLLKEIRDMHYRGMMPPNYLLEGLKEMAFVLGSWTRTKEKLKQHHKEIPPGISHGELIEQISRTVAKLETLSQQETERRGRQEAHRGREKHATFDSPQKTPAREGERRKSITMKLSTSTSQVLTHKEDNQKISMKLSVPQTVVVSTSLEEDSGSDISVGQEGGGSLAIPPPPLAQKLSSRGFEGEAVVLSSGNRGPRARVKAEQVGIQGDMEEEEEGRDYEEGDFIYPSLEGELGLLSNTSPVKGHKRKSDDDDDLWMPQGPVKLVKGSIASSSRQKRNARKRSFEYSMSAASTKMTKMEEEHSDGTPSSAPHMKPALIPEAKATDPVLGGGSLMVGGGEQSATEGGAISTHPQRSRAAAAASAVNAALAASKPKSKPLTAKQRLGKIMGLSRGGRWK